MLINKDKYNIYCKYDGDSSYFYDFRSGSFSDQKKITSDEWNTIEELIENLSCLNTKLYSSSLEEEMKNKISTLSQFFPPDVMETIKEDCKRK